MPVTLSVVVPCYNEEKTLEESVGRLLAIQDDALRLEVIIVNDCSRDRSLQIAGKLAAGHSEVKVLRHERNRGKGAALRTGFAATAGDFVAVHDADLEYDPRDLKRLVEPLAAGDADVVFGSRFQSAGAHRVLYFWHSVGNHVLTFISNMATDLNLTDMETCYKLFRRDVIQSIVLEEDRFGFEPEIVAKVAQKRLRVYEMGISYRGRTYTEGKKIGMKDGWRALFAILKYSMNRATWPLQLAVYLCIGGCAAAVDLAVFLGLYRAGLPVRVAAPVAFVAAAFVNYFLCISFLFRHRARWSLTVELALFFLVVVGCVGWLDMTLTAHLIGAGIAPAGAKLSASAAGFILNFLGRKFLVFPEPANPDWAPQNRTIN